MDFLFAFYVCRRQVLIKGFPFEDRWVLWLNVVITSVTRSHKRGPKSMFLLTFEVLAQ